MQNVGQSTGADNKKLDKVNVKHGVGISSTPNSAISNNCHIKNEQVTYNQQSRFMSDSSESEDDSVSEVSNAVFTLISIEICNIGGLGCS